MEIEQKSSIRSELVIRSEFGHSLRIGQCRKGLPVSDFETPDILILSNTSLFVQSGWYFSQNLEIWENDQSLREWPKVIRSKCQLNKNSERSESSSEASCLAGVQGAAAPGKFLGFWKHGLLIKIAPPVFFRVLIR